MEPGPVDCPSCKARLKLKADLPAGKSIRCPKCGHAFAPVAASSASLAAPARTQNLDPPAPPSFAGASSVPPKKVESDTISSSQGPGASLLATEERAPNQEDDNDIPADHSFLHPPHQPGDLGRLNHYRIIKVLGAGGMGLVYQGEDYLLQRPVAVKIMLPEYAKKASAKQRFLREARAAAAIEHDHIIAIHEVNEDNGVPYLIMPLLKGESLADRLKREKKLPIAEVIRIARETALGLAEAHEHGLIHRDIKPSNLWLESKTSDKGRVTSDKKEVTSEKTAIAGDSPSLVPRPSSLASSFSISVWRGRSRLTSS